MYDRSALQSMDSSVPPSVLDIRGSRFFALQLLECKLYPFKRWGGALPPSGYSWYTVYGLVK